MNAIQLLLWGWLLAAAIMFILYLLQRAWQDASIVDVGWTANLGILAILYGWLGDGYGPRQALVAAGACLWSFRLAAYLLFNRVIGKEEDGRYQTIRRNKGDKAQVFFFWFFQIQGALDVLFSLSFLTAALNPRPFLGVWDYLGLSIILVSVGGESLADWQLARFRADPNHKGKTCRMGLWRYSRHPNYFFEWLHWWAYLFFAVGSPYIWITLLSPALMLYFLLRVTGIPATEAQALASRGEDYRDYQRTTSAFIPWFPKESGK